MYEALQSEIRVRTASSSANLCPPTFTLQSCNINDTGETDIAQDTIECKKTDFYMPRGARTGGEQGAVGVFHVPVRVLWVSYAHVNRNGQGGGEGQP